MFTRFMIFPTFQIFPLLSSFVEQSKIDITDRTCFLEILPFRLCIPGFPEGWGWPCSVLWLVRMGQRLCRFFRFELVLDLCMFFQHS